MIDVIIASSNPLQIYGEAVIKQSLESLKQQTYQDWHLLLCNYGPLEETQKIAAFLPQEKITIINEGDTFTKALNAGLRYSKAPLIARQDLDDWSLPERFHKEVTYLTDHPEVILVGTMAYIADRTGKNLTPLKKPVPVFQHKEILKAVWQCNCYVHGSVMFQRALVLKEIGFYDESYSSAQDFDYWCRIMIKFPVGNLEDRLYVWRDHPNSISAKMGGRSAGNKQIALAKWGKDLKRRLQELG